MQDEVRPLALSPHAFLALFLILAAIACVPLLLTELPPLLDYPNHLARMHLLAADPPALQPFYAIAWAPLPNLAMDGIVSRLARLVPLAWAGKIFLVLTFCLIAGGTAAIYRVLFRHWSLWPLLAFLFLYTRLLLWGFVGYLCGCGLALCCFAAWTAIARRHWALRMVLGCIFALVIYFAHLLAFGIYAVMLGCFEVGEALRLKASPSAAARALLIGGIPFLPALALMATNFAPGPIVFANPLRKFDLLFSVFDDYSRPFDIACFALFIVAGAWAYCRGWVKVAPAMALPLLGLVILYLALPTQLATASGADRRIPMMIFLALIGGSRWTTSVGLERRVLGAAVAMFAARIAVIAVVWHEGGELYASSLAGLDSIPAGSCVASAYDDDAIAVQKAPLTHFPTMAVARRDAFVTTLFAYPQQQPIALRPAAAALANALGPGALWHAYVTASAPLSADAQSALAKCDFVAFAGSRPFELKTAAGLDPAFSSPRFKLYRILRPVSAP